MNFISSQKAVKQVRNYCINILRLLKALLAGYVLHQCNDLLSIEEVGYNE